MSNETSGIRVSIGPPTPEGRLWPRYHNSIGILTLGSALPRPCPFGVNVGPVILDIDADARLANVELILPMRAWKARTGIPAPTGKAGDLLIRGCKSPRTDLDLPVTVHQDVQTDEATIAFGPGEWDRAVSLSNHCFALLQGDRLAGFWFRLRKKSG